MKSLTPMLHMRGIHKSFPGVHVLCGVDLDVERGEVHALLGENGAGKSTLMHILAGVHQPDQGAIAFDGHESRVIENERHAQQLGISIVYQERSLFSQLTVAENICASNLPVHRFGVIDRTVLRQRSRKVLDQLEQDIDPDTLLNVLSPAQQQMVEIAKALVLEAKLLILDEPTSALTEPESAALFRVMRRLQENGVSMIYISHRMEEIFEIAQRVTVLRDGECRGTFATAEVNSATLVRHMVGRELMEQDFPDAPPQNSRTILEVSNLSDREGVVGSASVSLRNISFSLRNGEILAFAGLAGAGRTELALSIFGARSFAAGSIQLNGKSIFPRTPRSAIAEGIGYVPEDRKESGLFLEMSIADNIAAANLKHFGSWKLNDRKRDKVAAEFIEKLRIRTRDSATPVGKLSGGNQQKAVLARWLLRGPAVLMIDEPTRGIDVAAKAEVHALIHRLAREGTGVIVISSDLPEVLTLADRILVMQSGRIAGELSRQDATEEKIMQLAAVAPVPGDTFALPVSTRGKTQP